MPSARHAARAIVVMLAARSAWADLPDARDHATPCRPTVSCTAELSAPGTFEVETGFQSSRNAFGATTLITPFLLKQTMSKMLQLQVGGNGYTAVRGDSPHADYFDNLLFGAKLHLHDQDRFTPSVCVTALVGVPMFSAVGYVQRVNAFVTAHASKDFGPIHADLNAGLLEWGTDSAAAVSQGLVSLALSTSLPPPFGVALETYYFSDQQPVALRDGGVRGVITTTPKPWLVFDMGGDVGFFPSTRALSVFFGMTIVPVVLWR